MVAIKWCHRRNNKLWLALCFSGRYSHGKWLHAHTHTHTHLISAEDGKSIYIMEEERIILLIWKLLLFNVRNMVAHASQRQHQLFFFDYYGRSQLRLQYMPLLALAPTHMLPICTAVRWSTACRLKKYINFREIIMADKSRIAFFLLQTLWKVQSVNNKSTFSRFQNTHDHRNRLSSLVSTNKVSQRSIFRTRLWSLR